MIAALLPCPFCGHEHPEFERMGDRRQSCIVICGNCGARHESGDEGSRNGSSWNQRSEPGQDGLRATLETALARIEDMLADDDGQAFKEARKFLESARPLTASPTEQDAKPKFINEEEAINHYLLTRTPSAPTGKDSLAVEPDERAEFEAWYMQEYPTLDHAQILTRQRDWTYKFSHVQAIWEAWQAARASKGTK